MWGHISCRSPRGDSFLILPMRPPYDHSLAEDELLEYDLEGKLIAGRRDPPAEIFFFTALYKSKKDVGAVIHCHPPAAVSLVATGKKIVPMYQHGIKFGKGCAGEPLAIRHLARRRRAGGQGYGRKLRPYDEGSWGERQGKNDSGSLPERGSFGADGEDDLTGGKRRSVQSAYTNSSEKIPRCGSWQVE